MKKATHTFDMRMFQLPAAAWSAFTRAAAVLFGDSIIISDYAARDGVFVRYVPSNDVGSRVEVGIVVVTNRSGMLDIDADVVRERLDIIDKVVAARDFDLVQEELARQPSTELRN